MQKFNTFYVDPPWEAGNSGTDALRALPIGDWCLPNSMMLLWFPSAELPKHLKVLEAWGFNYLQLWTWVYREGFVGHWNRFRAEHLLLGVKGAVQVDYLIRQNVFKEGVIDGGRHPEYFKDLALQAAVRAFTQPIMLEVFGAYWHRRDSRYQEDDWSWWEGSKIVD